MQSLQAYLNGSKLGLVVLAVEVVMVLVADLRRPHPLPLLWCQLLCSFLQQVRLQNQLLDLQRVTVSKLKQQEMEIPRE